MARQLLTDYLQSFRYGLRDVTAGTKGVFSTEVMKSRGPTWWKEQNIYVALAKIANIELSTESEIVEPLNGTFTIPYVKHLEHGTLLISKGVLATHNDFMNWLAMAVNGNFTLRDGAVVTTIRPARRVLQVDVFAAGGLGYTIAKSYVFHNCIPLTFYVEDLDASSGDILLENLEIGFTKFDVVVSEAFAKNASLEGNLLTRFPLGPVKPTVG
jgi:hypothetical protein